MLSKVTFLAGATLVACMDPITPAAEDLSTEAKSNIITEVNLRRSWHGTCNPLVWDDTLAADIKSWIVDSSSGTPQCTSQATKKGQNAYNVWVTTFQYNPPPVWNPATAATEWYNSASGQGFENVVWNGATKMACAQCRAGTTNQGHMTFVYCQFADITGTSTENINPVNTTCDKCIGKPACDAPAACKQPGTCNPATGDCEYLNVADGAMCDDGDATTTNDVCTAGVCSGTSKCLGVTCAPTDPACANDGMCDPMTGQCIPNNKADDTACDDNNAATQNDKCVNGVCLGADLCANKAPCTAPDACHLAGICNPLTGDCTHPKQPVGTMCNDGDDKTQHDTCDSNGMCVGVDLCATSDCKTSECVATSTCNPATGKCEETNKADDTMCDDGEKDTVDDKCVSGACVGTDTGCGSVTCTVDPATCQKSAFCISQTAGMAATCGYTYMTVGAACGPGQDTKCVKVGATVECKVPDLCANKTCVPDQCATDMPSCDSATGVCSYTNKPDGTPCDDKIPQTVDDVCTNGMCAGENKCAHTDCSSFGGKCTDSQCNPMTGMCDTVNKQDGIPCDDADDHTVDDKCTAGVCKGDDKCVASTCVKNPPEQCVETQGSCEPMTGNCMFKNKADGVACDDGDDSTQDDACMNGKCTSGTNCEIKLIKQWSRTKCVFGKTYGFTPEGKLFVKKGCRGKFKIVANDHVLKCASRRWKYTECGTYPLLPGCTNNDPEPCPTNTKCPGFTKLGEGNCLDAAGEQFNKATKTVRSKAECIQIARDNNHAVSGVEYAEATKKCTLIVPAGIPLPRGNWDNTKENNQGVAPVVSTDGASGVSCWVPENRCLGVMCQAKSECHEVGVCEPQTGMCTNPEKSKGSWCDDGDATTWGDKCTNGVCAGNTGSPECWRANSWYGVRECVKDDHACGWGSGVYANEQECCDNSFRNGCQSKPSDECWVGGDYWPKRTCKKINSRNQCGMSGGCWQTEEKCCEKGSAHKQGCHAQPDDDADDGVADRPEQCICDQSMYDMGMDNTIEEYCASKTSPNNNGHICALPISTGKCEKGFLFCRKAKTVPKKSGEVCACGALKANAGNHHTRLCVDRTVNGQNACYPSNSNGACGMVQWSICVTKTSLTITITPNRVSSAALIGHVSIMSGFRSRSAVAVVSSCRKGRRYGSRYAMRNGGCKMGGWRTPSRHAMVLGGEVEKEEVTLEWSGLTSDEMNDAERQLKVNMDIMKADPKVREVVLKNDPDLAAAMTEFGTYAEPGVEVGPAPTDESDEELNGGDDDKKTWLFAALAAAGGSCMIATIVFGVVYKRRQASESSDTHSEELVAHEEFSAERNIAMGKVSEEEVVESESLRV
eukprot:TRINITY_DN6703_c0_g1_i1.p1 TRINITY_DN6703_c0_g1~~TRINITY_DN6703_c0_g1_i1.p1  ORF type:complete len:1364 (+),score=407.94 TRINITY_DN6703_c0_g1_i1:46-4092(+)